ncbi:MAG: BBP7 family outer membrane beta-barrel protein [Pirellulaceae bacterium]|nr:BBP7 family outer membrane beta-barrel protein [Pirellulaceae bacterium]
MQKSLSAWLMNLLVAVSAGLSLATIATAQEASLDYLNSYVSAPPVQTSEPAAQQGCQGNCGWISDGCCADDCCFPRTTARLEYLLWFGRGQNIPALVTTSPAGTPQADAGVLGLATTTTLFGDEGIQQNLRSGFRITINHLLDSGDTVGARFWALENARKNFDADSTGNPILARPFFNTQLPGEDALLVAFPGVTTDGSVSVRAGNEILGADAWFRRTISRDACFQMDWLAGYQFVRMNDSIFIRNPQTDVTGGAFPIGTIIDVQDNFRTSSEFHGGTLGVVIENRYDVWQLDLLAKVALGNMHQTVNVSGSTTVTEPGLGPVTSSGGLLAQGTNSGIRTRNRLAFIPEVNLNLGYRVNDQWSLTMGYSFVYFSDVVVAGGQIDPAVNLSQNPGPIVGPISPAPLLNTTDYWVQGLSLGVDYQF